ncbi:MAG TPA: tRNA pseudouridine(55) synthase TruB [Polyangiaceae bacterium]|nr:tRNA pseudouridine(55) synthase TruB [Polyangiaceae bacterium]
MKGQQVDGVLPVDKPQGKTSHDVVAEARRLFGTRAVGHAGTLDPMATGVLLLLFGEACKLSNYLTAEYKTYRARVRFGASTDSLDADGRVLESVELAPSWLSEEALESALRVERCRLEQVPPAVSAIHSDGERAHVRARRGEAVELPPRPVAVRELRLLRREAHELELELCVSKGYYVRSLARDLGSSLGQPAHLSALRRLSSGAFTLAHSVAWPCVERPSLMPTVEAACRALPVLRLTESGVLFARQGKRLGPEQVKTPAAPAELPPIQAKGTELEREPQVSVWLSPAGELVALGTWDGERHRVVRGFASN